MPAPPLAYAFQPDEKIRDGVVRVLGEISMRGQELTRRSPEPAGAWIHEGRLLIKRTRALLGFARPALSLATHTRARTRLQRAADLLADQRDLKATQATLEKLARKAASHARDRKSVKEIYLSLVVNPTAGEAPEKASQKTLRKARKILRLCVNEMKRSASSRTAWPSPSKCVAKAFRAMRRAGKKARRTGKDVNFHTWRKKAKRLLYQLELTQASPTRRMARVMKRVGKLQETLGAYPDGVVVEERLRQTLPPALPCPASSTAAEKEEGAPAKEGVEDCVVYDHRDKRNPMTIHGGR